MNQGLGEPYEIPVPWFLITHPRGNVVIDGGTAVEYATDPGGHWGVTRVYWPVMQEQGLSARCGSSTSRRRACASCCSLICTSITPEPSADSPTPHLVQRSEYQYAFTPDWFAAGGYIRRLRQTGPQVAVLEGETSDYYDLYGDGSIVLVFTPGHSPGHQSFLITLPRPAGCC